MNEPGAHPRGFYPKHPDVTWDLAQERYLQHEPGSRSLIIQAECLSCGGWEAITWIPRPKRIAERIERVAIEIAMLEGQHWYQCPSSKQPRIRTRPDLARLLGIMEA